MMGRLATQVCFVTIFISYSVSVLGQEAIGLNPPSMKWSQISTPAGRIIFPRGLDSTAFYTARLMQYQRTHDNTITGDHLTKRVPVILQNQSTLPAGFSTPAPWRNEYYLTPPQNMFLGPIRWDLAMPIHEYRHAQQFSMGSGGFTWIYRILMGQTGWLFNSLMTQPLWFREGDAVVAETVLTQGGRGRLPSFHMEYRAMRLAGYRYNYEKAHYTSFRDFVPNPYRIGYYMVTKARRDFGDDIWTRTLEDAYHRKGFIYPFSRSLKKYTGLTTKALYNATVAELDSLWSKSDESRALTPSVAVSTNETRKYTSYRYPHDVGGGNILVVKSGLDLINTFYTIRGGVETKLFPIGQYTEDHITAVVEGDLLTWAESGFHERWINKDYSVIKTFDFKTGKTTKLTSRTRFFSPAPSPNGEKIIVLETDTNIRHTLVILNAHTGRELKRLPAKIFYSHMRWQNDRFVIAVRLNDRGNAIVRIDTEGGTVETLLDDTTMPISRPYPFSGYIFFSAGNNGVNNIFALKTDTKQLLQVTNVRFGAFEPSVSRDGSSILFSEYTADGYRINSVSLDPSAWRSADLQPTSDIYLDTAESKDLGELPLTAYPVRKFHALTSGLFNFYGWIPLPNIPEYGVELYTRNLMSTLAGTLGYAYNTNEDRSRHYARLTYAALYPHMELNVGQGMRHSANILSRSSGDEFFEQDWRETTLSAGMRLPLRLTQGTHTTRLSLGAFYEYYDITSLDSADVSAETGTNSFHGWKAEFDFSRLRLQARQHVKPRWGQELRLEYNKAIDDVPERLVAHSAFYFPGITRAHSLNFRLAYRQEEVYDTYRFRDDLAMPRGYETMPFEDLYVASANYELPLWYPDLSAGSVLFFQRLRANLFFDLAEGQTGQLIQPLTSTGADLLFDLRFFRLFQSTIAFRFNVPFDNPASGTLPFQFLITRFELAN